MMEVVVATGAIRRAKLQSYCCRSPLFYHESWQNDICSFRAITVAPTVSFKLISF